jgi:Tfp pilus assembly PilM family ATPase
MVWFLNNQVCPIGVDMGSKHIKLAQLSQNEDGIAVLAAARETKPEDIDGASSTYQRWAIKTIRDMISQGVFKGKKVITALPASDIFIDQVKVSRVTDEQMRPAVLSKVESHLPFDPAGALVQFIIINPGSECDVLVLATERTKVDRHLAIYEQAGLNVQAISLWPLAMVSAYTSFFGRRRSDLESVVLLLEMGANCAKIVICRHSELLFARLVPIGMNHLTSQEMLKRLVHEIVSCVRYFDSTMRGIKLDRLLFLTGQGTDKDLCEAVVQLAQHLQIPAQIGDVLAAVHVGDPDTHAVERRNCTINWTAAFGLSLSSEGK